MRINEGPNLIKFHHNQAQRRVFPENLYRKCHHHPIWCINKIYYRIGNQSQWKTTSSHLISHSQTLSLHLATVFRALSKVLSVRLSTLAEFMWEMYSLTWLKVPWKSSYTKLSKKQAAFWTQAIRSLGRVKIQKRNSCFSSSEVSRKLLPQFSSMVSAIRM